MLKKLLINGFKSFAYKTVIDFSNGINIIVGPNGCGKSNIIDAIRWVLGEQGTKMLRASSGTDVIFGGSDAAPPASYAEVSIIIDNSAKILNVDFDDVVVTRKLFRSGESYFYINKREVRLKDIHNLFFDTGLGKGSYSIIQQGQIDAILSSNPAERRAIFEEAAGIVSSKKLINETLSKLEKTSENLLRLEDIISEVQKNLFILKEQADKAKLYKSIEKSINDIEKSIFFSEYNNIKNEYNSLKNLEITLENEIESIKISIANIEHNIDNIIDNISDYEAKISVLRNEEKRLEIEEYKLGEKINILRGEDQRLRKEFEKCNISKEKLLAKIKDTEKILSYMENELNNINTSIKEYEQKDQEFFSSILEIESYINLTLKSLENLKNENKSINEQINSILSNQSLILKDLFKRLEDNKDIIVSSLKGKKDAVNKVSNYINKLNIIFSYDSLESKKSEVIELLNLLKKEFEIYNIEIQKVFSIFEEANIMILDEYANRVNLLRDTYTKNLNSIQNLEDDINKSKSSKDKITELKNQNYLNLTRTKDKYINMLSEIDRVKKEYNELNNSLKDIENNLLEIQNNIEEIESQVFSVIDSYEAVKEKLSKIQKEKKEHENKTLKMSDELRRFEKEKSVFSEKLSSAYERKNKLNLKLSEVTTKKNILQSQFFEKYGENIDSINSDIVIKDYDNLKLQLIELKKKQQELWPVNLLAIDEYEEVNKRYEYLNNNKNDILKAKRDLETIIEETNKKMRDEFLKSFEQIRKNLEYTFKRAFGGGECIIEIQDRNDILNSGIEIIARPPGKKLKNINLLSGGERSMIALSIIFAIFMRKISPFCLLDEVDAALDEANVKRFITLVEDFSKNTQFIIITHNRITAQHGDVFFGVTMQDPGITKVFSFKPDYLEDTIKEGIY
ncbi:MAG TPA: AAA family ATPase [Spirochaetota bacterium]|nr:AAA family ATPase [Spirochaetota bacterium]HOM38849.1 AAA family ATPase [Spirochaetota bacterium]HPQ49144.1 AAA family ATPase [Spirochaetota bacterium]